MELHAGRPYCIRDCIASSWAISVAPMSRSAGHRRGFSRLRDTDGAAGYQGPACLDSHMRQAAKERPVPDDTEVIGDRLICSRALGLPVNDFGDPLPDET